MKKIKAVFWDFDGVLLNSNEVRDQGFVRVLADYPQDQVDRLLSFHRQNGGLSRYVKFRYFYEEILGEALDDERLAQLCASFSEIMRLLLTDKNLLISENINRLRKSADLLTMYIVSGSDQTELRYLCEELKIEHWFKGIYGSPTPKNDLVESVLRRERHDRDECVLIGDSVNDLTAARHNGIRFVGFNNAELERQSELSFIEVFGF